MKSEENNVNMSLVRKSPPHKNHIL